ncbi:hypothetical protein AAMO2058_000686100 [Amorphochlora amoebiformis]
MCQGLARSFGSATRIPRLILAGSNQCIRHIQLLKSLSSSPLKRLRVAYIPTAYTFLEKDSKSTRSIGDRRRRRMAEARKKGRILGEVLDMEVETVELSKHISVSRQRLSRLLGGVDIVYVDGGNTYYLLECMRLSGFCEEIRERDCIYVGVSAGAISAGRSIETVSWKGWDDITIAPDTDWSLKTALEGLRLTEKVIFPHFDPELHSELVERKTRENGWSIYDSDSGDGDVVLLGDQDVHVEW